MVNEQQVRETVVSGWADRVLPSLSGLVEIPALSPAFDASWAANGQLQAAVDHVRDWIDARGLPGAKSEVVQLRGPFPAAARRRARDGRGRRTGARSCCTGTWTSSRRSAAGPRGSARGQPVLRQGRLYGRGAVDDGYSGYAAVTALEAARAAGGGHARAILLLETGEESGSPDLPAYMEHLAGRLGDVTFVVCLDGGGANYERLWLTTSLRGIVQATVTVRVLDAPQHSGLASGIVPSSFRILRQLLDRLEDSATGQVRLGAMSVAIPAEREAAARQAAAADPGAVQRLYPLVEGLKLAGDDVELILNNTWRPTLSVIGAAGLPEPADAGNVLRAWTTLTLSFRIPPLVDAAAALAELEQALTTDVPLGARVELTRHGRGERLERAAAGAVAGGRPGRGLRTGVRQAARGESASAGLSRSWNCWAGCTRRPSSW